MVRENLIKHTLLLTGVITSVAGISALVFLITRTLPTVPNRWFFFLFFTISSTGLAILAGVFIRHLRKTQSDESVLIRQAVWIGIMAGIIAWLKIADLLHLPILFFLILTIILIEFLLTKREKAERKVE